MGQALYRTNRPKSFKEVFGQDHITTTLQNAIKSGKLSHAYLFTGPRGVGKTSVARILAHEVNSIPYDDESIHLDIIEIDAASNRRIDEIRDLRDKVRIAPAAAKYKVYIIDEVHMLTREAFNALLKTLEEPPAHCIFILATTEAHKLPETIVSRTQRFEFKPVSKAQSAAHLANIAKHEKIDATPEALDLLAEFGNGSFRDSISYLDQLSSLGKKIEEEDVRQVLGLPAGQAIDQLLDTLSRGDSAGALNQLGSIGQQGVAPAAVAAALSNRLRSLALNDSIQPWQVGLLKQLLQVSASSSPQEVLEVSLLEICAQTVHTAAVVDSKLSESPKPSQKTVKPESKMTKTREFDLSQWDEIVARSKNEAASIYTALRLAKPSYESGVLTLNFQFPLHQKKLSQAKNKELVYNLVKEFCGAEITIKSAVIEIDKPIIIEEPVRSSSVNAISNIFGSAEVLEA